MAKKRRRGHPAGKGPEWQPLKQSPLSESDVQKILMATLGARADLTRMPDGSWRVRHPVTRERFGDMDLMKNREYSVLIYRMPDGSARLSLHRTDNAAIRDWRHMQQIKNECAGAEVEAYELFPAESRLMDTVNEYTIWCLPPGERLPVGFPSRSVAGPGEWGPQRAWQPGLTTGPASDAPGEYDDWRDD